MKTVFDLNSQERRIVQKLVVDRLHQQHDLSDLTLIEECSKRRKADQSALFGNHLDRVPTIYVDDCGMVPLFLYHCVTALSQFTHLEGIFRKAGSIQRQKELRNRFEQGQNMDIGDISLAYDVASLIKQFLRELPEPILVESLASSCLQCAQSTQAVLLLCLLLPSANISALKYVCQFLKQVSDSSEQNKMSVRNLALVFSPSLFPNEPIRRLNNNLPRETFESAQFHDQILVLELLISNANSIGVLPAEFITAVESASSKSSDDETSQSNSNSNSGVSTSSAEALDGLERSKDASVRSRKRKSRGSIHNLFTDISHSFAKLRRTSFGQAKENVAPKFEESLGDTFKESSVCIDRSSFVAELSGFCNANERNMKRRSNNMPIRRLPTENFEAGAQVIRFRKSLDSQPLNSRTNVQEQSVMLAKCASKQNMITETFNSLVNCRTLAWQPVKASPTSNPCQVPCTAENSTDLKVGRVNSCASEKRTLDASPTLHRGERAVPVEDFGTQLLGTPKFKPQMANFDLLRNRNTLGRSLQPSSDRKRICVAHEDRRQAVRVNLL